MIEVSAVFQLPVGKTPKTALSTLHSDMTNLTYPVHEMFYTWQGEGVHMGHPAFFVRLFGCPVHCPWCDSAGTWHKDYIPKNVQRLTAGEILEALLKTEALFVVLTGGEPAIHDLTELCKALDPMEVHLETSGAFDLRGAKFKWITVSPKRWKLPITRVVKQANEFKFIIEHPDDIAFYTEKIIELGYTGFCNGKSVPIWLHPEWSQRGNPKVLHAISDAVKASKESYRAGWQLHKLYMVDTMDPRSRPMVPLGGNPTLGY